MKLIRRHWIGIGVGVAILIANVLLFSQRLEVFYFVIGIAFLVSLLPFVASVVVETGREKEKEEKFLEFSRSLMESVKSGTPISKSIINIRNKDFGSLTPHVKKLANQIALGISVRKSLKTFAEDIGNKVISRSIALITEAEESGGQIDLILESTAKSVSEIEDIKKEQRTSLYNFVVQGYIIFMIFLVIMLVVQLKFIPAILKTVTEAGIGGGGVIPGLGLTGTQGGSDSLNNMFFILIIVQSFFTGLVIGKLAEGKIRSGVKHSFIMTAIAYLITTGARIVF